MSSSAQLLLLPWLFGAERREDQTTFAAGLHAGSSAGIALAVRRDLLALDRAGAARLLATSLPAAAAGLLVQDAVESRLGRPGPTAALLAGAGGLLWWADRRPEVRSVGTRESAVAAIAQVLALAPGVSRSGASLTALRFLGVRRDEALRYSLLMSLPVTVAAAGLTSVRAGRMPDAVPSALAAVSSYATLKGVERASFSAVTAAALYRLGLATAVGLRLRTKGKR